MSIVKMKKLELVALQSQKEKLLRELMLLNCVEIRDPELPEEETRVTQVKSKELTNLRSQVSTLTTALQKLDIYAPDNRGLLTPLPDTTTERILDESKLSEDMDIAQKILDGEVKIRSIASKENSERMTIDAMQPWMTLDEDLGKTETGRCSISYGTLPATVQMESAKAALADLEAEMEQASEDKSIRYVIMVYLKERTDDVLAALKPYGFTQINMIGRKGTPEQIVAESNKQLETLAADKEEARQEIVELSSSRRDLELGIETLQTIISREEAGQKLLNTKQTFMFNGWVPEPETEKLEKVLAGYDCAWEITGVEDEDPKKVPVKIKSNLFTTPANMLTEMYSLPQYNTLDPAPFVAPFFVLFFGIMFADMAYGIILFLAGIVILKVKKPAKGTGMRYMGGLCVEGGITTFIMGFLTGGFFGDATSQIAGWFGKSFSIVPTFATLNIAGNSINLPLNLLEGNNPLFVLIGAICLGAVHLLIGVLIGCYLKIKEGQWFDAVFNDLCWWVMFAGIGVYVLAGSPVVIFIGLAMMVIGAVGSNKGFGRITGIVSAVYNGATGYLGDLLSYSRLMALMLAGSVIASVFNQLGSLGNANGPTVIGTILFIVVFLIGHVLNFALNLIGCFVHALRLQYLEFFGKWYRDGGKPFRPLSIKTKYFNVSKEEH